MSVHSVEAGRSRELWPEVLPGPLALSQVLCGLGTMSLNSDLPSPDLDVWLNVTVQFLSFGLGDGYKVQVYAILFFDGIFLFFIFSSFKSIYSK